MRVLQTQRMAEIRKCVITEFGDETVEIVINMYSSAPSHEDIKTNLSVYKCSKLLYSAGLELNFLPTSLNYSIME